ncbi:hypothetical protein ACHAWF_003304 [Thalassiosira exigua]
MLTDVDLDGPDEVPLASSPASAPASAPPPPSGAPRSGAGPARRADGTGGGRTRPTPPRPTPALRGRTSHHFSVKRPRRNVARRSIASLPARGGDARLDAVEEEEGGTAPSDPAGATGRGGGRDPRRAPRIALALLLTVCSLGSYRGFGEWRAARDVREVARRAAAEHDEEASGSREGRAPSFRGAAAQADEEHRGALLLTPDAPEGRGSGETAQNVEDARTLSFDEPAVDVPPALSHLADVSRAPYDPRTSKLFLWHVPRSGSTSLVRIASHCLGLTIASDAGKSEVRAAGEGDRTLRIVEGPDGTRYANVDASHPAGIRRAGELGLGRSEEVDLISSPYLWDLAGIFEEGHGGYTVAMLRHPIERAASLYHSMRKDPRYEGQVGSMASIEQYAKSSLVENNWMTRFLSNALSGELTPEHEATAKDVLRTKCIVGLLHDKTETMRRLEVLFDRGGRSVPRSRRRDECQEKLLYWDWPGKNRHETVTRGTEAWDALSKQNAFDLRLYEYAMRLFEAQGKLFEDAPGAKRR